VGPRRPVEGGRVTTRAPQRPGDRPKEPSACGSIERHGGQRTIMSRLTPVLTAVRIGCVALALTACAGTAQYAAPSASMTSLIPGWERYFTVEWSVEPERGGLRRLDGYVFNRYGEYAAEVRLLVQALDASGAIVDQRVVWGPPGVGGFGRAYFNVRNVPTADHYRVSVWDYRLIQGASLLP
jgi:hypothetical protein